MKLIVMAALALAAFGAQAQVFKCTTPGGKLEYRGSPCDDTRQATGMAGGTVSGIDAMSEKEMSRADAPAEQQRHQQTTVVGQQPGAKAVSTPAITSSVRPGQRY